jgi:amino acid transporter
VVIYAAHRIWFWSEPWAYPPEEVDLQTGLEEIIAEETPGKEFKGWQKIRHIWE